MRTFTLYERVLQINGDSVSCKTVSTISLQFTLQIVSSEIKNSSLFHETNDSQRSPYYVINKTIGETLNYNLEINRAYVIIRNVQSRRFLYEWTERQ